MEEPTSKKIALTSGSIPTTTPLVSETAKTHTKPKTKKQVICISRRTDVPSNETMLDKVLAGFVSGTITYDFPRFVRNPGPIKQTKPVSLRPEDVEMVSWWSKDFANLLAKWDTFAEVLSKYHHHFTFTINGPEKSALEPGLKSTLAARFEQLALLVRLCKEVLNQDPAVSITVHVDPISVYRLPKSANPAEEHHTLGHIEALCNTMRALGLTKIHMSFTQFGWPSVRKYLNDIRGDIDILDPNITQCKMLLATHFFPYTKGLEIETCTAIVFVAAQDADMPQHIRKGACVGRNTVIAVTGNKSIPDIVRKPVGKSTANCTCFPFKDIGSAKEECSNSCRYCFMNSKKLPIPTF